MPSQAVAAKRAVPLDPAKLGSQVSTFEDRIVSKVEPRRQKRRASGGVYTAYTGEQIRVFLSDSYEPDPSVNQSYADFLAGLIHRHEFGRATVFIVTPEEIDALCGPDATACYDARDELLIVPGEPPPDGSYTVEDVTTHEYGHHIANNRINPPFDAMITGPKRWASYQGVCPNVTNGWLDLDRYEEHPAEGWAEAYLVTNGGQWGEIAIDFYYPDNRALAYIHQDVRKPWTKPRRLRFTARFKKKQSRTARIRTPLDGTLKLRLNGPRRSDFDLFLLDGKRIVKRSTGPLSREKLKYTICGETKLKAQVFARRGPGRGKLRVSVP